MPGQMSPDESVERQGKWQPVLPGSFSVPFSATPSCSAILLPRFRDSSPASSASKTPHQDYHTLSKQPSQSTSSKHLADTSPRTNICERNPRVLGSPYRKHRGRAPGGVALPCASQNQAKRKTARRLGMLTWRAALTETNPLKVRGQLKPVPICLIVALSLIVPFRPTSQTVLDLRHDYRMNVDPI